MRHTVTKAAVTAVFTVLAAVGCGSSNEPAPDASASSSSAVASPTPTVDVEAARQACKQGWLDGFEDGSVDDGQIPTECDGVPNSAQIGMEALQERNAANRERMDDCLENPACTELPIP